MNPDEMSSKIIEHGEDIRELKTRMNIMTENQRDIFEKLEELAEKLIHECGDVCNKLVATSVLLDGVVRRMDNVEQRLSDGDRKMKELESDTGFSAWIMKGMRKFKENSAYIFILAMLAWFLWVTSQWEFLKGRVTGFLK